VYLSKKCPKGGLASLSPTRPLEWNISDMTDLFLGKNKSTFASLFPKQLAIKDLDSKDIGIASYQVYQFVKVSKSKNVCVFAVYACICPRVMEQS
jgi:hypothetical protein